MSTETNAAPNNDPNIDDYRVTAHVNGTENDADGPKSVDVTVQDPPKDTNVEVEANIDGDGNTKVKVTFTPNRANGKAPKSQEDAIPKSDYCEGDRVDGKLLDKLVEAGGRKNADGSVTIGGKTVKPGDTVDSLLKAFIDAHDIKRDEVVTGDYRVGHMITPYMEQQLKEKGYKKDRKGGWEGIDPSQYFDVDGDGFVTGDDIEILKNCGIKKTSGYDRSNPSSPFKNDRCSYMTPDFAKKTGYPGKTDGPNPPMLGAYGSDEGVNNKNPNAAAVYEYNEETGCYEAVGEVWYDKMTKKETYYKYGAIRKKKVNDHQVLIGDEMPCP